MLGWMIVTKYSDRGSPNVDVHIKKIPVPNTLNDIWVAINIMTGDILSKRNLYKLQQIDRYIVMPKGIKKICQFR